VARPLLLATFGGEGIGAVTGRRERDGCTVAGMGGARAGAPPGRPPPRSAWAVSARLPEG
jgi:hypothetical protein